MGKVTRGSVGAERARASGAPTDPSTTSRGRFSVQKKTAAVLRMMRGESLDIVSRDLSTEGWFPSQTLIGIVIEGSIRGNHRAQSPIGPATQSYLPIRVHLCLFVVPMPSIDNPGDKS